MLYKYYTIGRQFVNPKFHGFIQIPVKFTKQGITAHYIDKLWN